MAKIIVFNNDTNRMETYTRSETSAMPYNTNRTLTVKEFRDSSNKVLWTTKRTMQSWNTKVYLGRTYQWDLHLKDLMKEDMDTKSTLCRSCI